MKKAWNYRSRAQAVLARFGRIAAKENKPPGAVVAHIDPPLAEAMAAEGILEILPKSEQKIPLHLTARLSSQYLSKIPGA